MFFSSVFLMHLLFKKKCFLLFLSETKGLSADLMSGEMFL